MHYFEAFDCEVTVVRNDEISFDNIYEFDKVVLSPGPGLPKESGELMKMISHCVESNIPLLGVCLGFQGIIEHFGGEIYNQNEVKHGVAETCFVQSPSVLFDGIPDEFKVGLYHSWACKEAMLPAMLRPTAVNNDGVLMALEHTELPICGVQFHPESIMTENGKQIIQNFLSGFNRIS